MNQYIDKESRFKIASFIIEPGDLCDGAIWHGREATGEGCQNVAEFVGLFELFAGDEDRYSSRGVIRLCRRCADQMALTDDGVDIVTIADARLASPQRVGETRGEYNGAAMNRRYSEIVDFLRDKPANSHEIAARFNYSYTGAVSVINRMLDAGMIGRERVKGIVGVTFNYRAL